jgi:hypothetical protein
MREIIGNHLLLHEGGLEGGLEIVRPRDLRPGRPSAET